MKKKDKKIAHLWRAGPRKEDLEAAEAYLALLFPPAEAKRLVTALRHAPVTRHHAKDLLRASQTHLLDEDNPHVAGHLKKVKKGKQMSPVLLVRGDAANGVTLTIADGHHRICASWHWDEDAPIACCLVGPD